MTEAAPPRRIDRLPVFLTAVWATFVAIAYIRSHSLSFPPAGFRLPGLRTLVGLAPGVAAAFLAWFGGHGLLILRGFRPESAVAAVTAFPVGLLITAVSGLTLGAVAGFNTGTLATTAILLAILAVVSLRATDWSRIASDIHSIFRPASVRFTTALIVLLAALNLPGATAPATSYDDQVYHLTITRLYQEAGRLVFLPDLPPANQPQSYHLFMTWVRLIGDDSAVRATNWLLAPGIAFALLLLLGKRLSPTAGACGALAFALHPQLAWLSRTASTDLIFLYLFLGSLFAVYEVANTDETGVSPALESLAILAGYAAQVQTTGAILAFLALPAGILALRLRADYLLIGPRLLDRGTRFFAGLLIISCPWYIRNWFTVGNPLYPHFTTFWTGKGYLPVHHAAFQALFHRPMPFVYFQDMLLDRFGMGRDLVSLLLLPWNATVHGHLHDAATPLTFFDGQIGFAPLASAPALLYAASRKEAGFWYRAGLGTAIVGAIIWALGPQQIRLLMPVLGLSAVLIGVLSTFDGRLRMLIAIILIAAAPSSLCFSAVRNAVIAPFTRGKMNSEAFLNSRLPFMRAYDYINTATASDAHVLTPFEERVYYLRRPFTWMELVPYPFISAIIASRDTLQLRNYLQAFGADVIYLPTAGRHSLASIIDDPGYRMRLNDLLASPSRLLYSDRDGEVWALND